MKAPGEETTKDEANQAEVQHAIMDAAMVVARARWDWVHDANTCSLVGSMPGRPAATEKCGHIRGEGMRLLVTIAGQVHDATERSSGPGRLTGR